MKLASASSVADFRIRAGVGFSVWGTIAAEARLTQPGQREPQTTALAIPPLLRSCSQHMTSQISQIVLLSDSQRL